jgi:fructose-1,6-bisphosphatase
VVGDLSVLIPMAGLIDKEAELARLDKAIEKLEKEAGKVRLRLLYECNPLAFIAEQAGGLATNGRERVLSINPERLHQRVSYFVGSKIMMEQAMSFMK